MQTSQCQKYYGWSPYVYCRNNPVIRIDPNGLTDYIYTSADHYYVENEDSRWIDWLIPDHYYVESDGKRFEAISQESIENSEWDGTIYLDWYKDEAGFSARYDEALSKYDPENNNPYSYALKQSPEGGLMDQKHSLLTKDRTDGSSVEAKAMYIVMAPSLLSGNVALALNWREAGNYVWGAAMRGLGIPWMETWTAAQLYSLYKNKQFDQPNEVKSFKLGYRKGKRK